MRLAIHFGAIVDFRCLRPENFGASCVASYRVFSCLRIGVYFFLALSFTDAVARWNFFRRSRRDDRIGYISIIQCSAQDASGQGNPLACAIGTGVGIKVSSSIVIFLFDLSCTDDGF